MAEIRAQYTHRLRLDEREERRQLAKGRHEGDADRRRDYRVRTRKGYFARVPQAACRLRTRDYEYGSGQISRSPGDWHPCVQFDGFACPPCYDRFNLVSDFDARRRPGARDRRARPKALERGDPHQVLLGVTGSGKTFTMAQTIARVNRPTLVMVHNKTLAAQLFQEFRRFFPENAVEYFVSYYDYYQPEAYVPATDSYIEKEATINDEIDRMRLSATRSLFERRDVIIVASVSCIYGLGSPEAYYGMLLPLERGQRIGREQVLRKLVEIQYERNDHDFAPRHLPRPRRHRRGLSRRTRSRGCGSSCSATRSTR